MHVSRLVEPRLQFGVGTSVDVRFGLMNYCVSDFNQEIPIEEIQLGVIGTERSIEAFCAWIDKCRAIIPAKDSRQPNLFVRFPGINAESGFRCEVRTDSSLHRFISRNEIDRIANIGLEEERTVRAVDLFVEHARDILEKRRPAVIVCALPPELLEAMNPPELEGDDEEIVNTESEKEPRYRVDFHDLLKARCLLLPSACPLQLVLPGTYDPLAKKTDRQRPDAKARPLQDEATRAWNFWTALYYKAGGTPWKLLRAPSELQTCHIGVGFFRTLDRERINTSVAQVFNERGEGVVVRGSQATFDKSDRQVHLDQDGANALVKESIQRYRAEHKTVPARVVIHKTSSFNAAEIYGFNAAINDLNIEYCEMLSLSKSFTRLFRKGEYPCLRGTLLILEQDLGILYTRGSVEFYETYPGMYMPRTLKIEAARTERSLRAHAEEILALTKMNWNDTQLDGSVPITIRAARQVGKILRYLAPSDAIPPKYSFYM
ncbi:MAG: hypothetical protein KF851_15550 [Pirellulaceae bacterium]|nr:hypothetical protein [Pirellulaceae bacterium]